MIKKNIVGMAGSLRPGSTTNITLRLILEEISKSQFSVEDLSLRHLNLPFFLSDENETALDSIKLFKEKIASASGIILATPEYHGSISGVLKNALDFLDEGELSGKLVGLVAVMGGNYGGSSVEHLKTVVHKLKGFVLPQDLVIQRASLIFDSNGNLNSQDIEKKTQSLRRLFLEGFDKISVIYLFSGK